MKRALVPWAALVISLAGACGGDSNPTPPSGYIPMDSGTGERGATLAPDTRPPASDGDATGSRGDAPATDTPLGSDGVAATDVAPPAVLTVTILRLTAGGSADGGGTAAPLDGGLGLPVFATKDRLAPTVRVEVESQGGDPTADVIASVNAVLLVPGTSSAISQAKLNQTQFQVDPSSGKRIYIYSDTPLDLSTVPTGPYTLSVTAVTAGGGVGTATTEVFIDGGPSITFLAPDNGAFVKGSVVVTAVVLDRAGVASVAFSVGQVQIPMAAISSNASQYTVTLDFDSFNPPLEGPQVVTVTAANSNGVVSIATRQFTVDNGGPSITGTKPEMGGLIGKLLTIEASVSDPAGVIESSVVAVVAHGDVHFEVRLEKGKDGAFRGLFDTTQLPVHALFPGISFRAQDALGNQSAVGYLVSLDNTPPILDLDPPEEVRILTSAGVCSWPFDPVGPDAIDDGSRVSQLFDIRARIEDQGNTPLTGIPDFIPIGAIDPRTVKVLILDDTSLPLVVDTSDPPDGVCDDVNPELKPSVSPESSKDAQLFDMVSLSPGGAGDFSHQPGVPCSGNAESPSPLCSTTFSLAKRRAMTYSMSYATRLPSIWTLPPIIGDGLQCAGRQFDASNNLSDGWACVAAVAADTLGNQQVSRPLRICVEARPDSTACSALGSGGADLASVTLPSSTSRSIVVTTKTPLLGPGDSPVAGGDVLVFTGVAPVAIAVLGGDHKVVPKGTTGTEFEILDILPAPYELWLDPLDGTPPVSRGNVGLLLEDGADLRVITDASAGSLDPGFTGRVMLIGRGEKVAEGTERREVAAIDATGFTLRNAKVSLGGFATPSTKLPNCTGTVVKATTGAPATVDGTIPCRPRDAFPDFEYIAP